MPSSSAASSNFEIDLLARFESFEIVTVTPGGQGYFYLPNAPLRVNANNQHISTYVLGGGATAFYDQGAVFTVVRVDSAAQWNAANVIDGSVGSIVQLTFHASNAADGFYDLTTNTFVDVDNIVASGPNVTLKINSAVAAEVAFFSGDAGSKLTTSDSALDLSTSRLMTDITAVSANTDGTIFTIGDAGDASKVLGGTGTDTLAANGFIFTAAQRDAIFASGSVEIIQDSSRTYLKPFGGPGDDDLVAPTGTASFNAGAGIDTVRFNFKLTEATVTYFGQRRRHRRPASHIVLTGFERFVFTDGTVDNNDGNRLVDDLFYYSHNHDVWNAMSMPMRIMRRAAGTSAAIRMRSSRPSIYLAINPDVRPRASIR